MGDTLLRGRRMRLTRLDGCGNPVLGPDSQIVTKGFVSVALTANTDTGTAITVVNANGEQCVNDTPTPRFTGFTAVTTLCGVDAEIVNFLTGNPLVLDADDNPIGFDDTTDVEVDLIGVAMELWTGISVDVCDESGETPYGYILLPFMRGGTFGDLTVQNDAINGVINGATTRNGTAWGVGPYDVINDDTGVPGPLLTPLTTKTHRRLIKTTVAPPDETTGAVALGVPATGAVAATGASTPANSYFPKNLTELQAGASGDHGVAVVASPTTAWTTGQNIKLRDGSLAHWTSSAWAAGPA